MELSNKYVVKGINREQIMNSVVNISIGAGGKIDKVEDRWNDKLPDGSISEVSSISEFEDEKTERQSTIARVWEALSSTAWSTFCQVSWWPIFTVSRVEASSFTYVLNAHKSTDIPKAQCQNNAFTGHGPQDRGGR